MDSVPGSWSCDDGCVPKLHGDRAENTEEAGQTRHTSESRTGEIRGDFREARRRIDCRSSEHDDGHQAYDEHGTPTDDGGSARYGWRSRPSRYGRRRALTGGKSHRGGTSRDADDEAGRWAAGGIPRCWARDDGAS